MGILKSQIVSNLGLKGETPVTRAGALPTSQMHAQGNIGAEAPGFGKVTAGFIASTPEEGSNLNYKTSREYSKLDNNGITPSAYQNPETGTGVK